jgi:hypothetical protein
MKHIVRISKCNLHSNMPHLILTCESMASQSRHFLRRFKVTGVIPSIQQPTRFSPRKELINILNSHFYCYLKQLRNTIFSKF